MAGSPRKRKAGGADTRCYSCGYRIGQYMSPDEYIGIVIQATIIIVFAGLGFELLRYLWERRR
jgi:uncharacterized protein (DUF983 family)